METPIFNYPRGSGRNVGPVNVSEVIAGITLAPYHPLPDKVTVPGESVEARQFIKCCEGAGLILPALMRVLHVPNGGARNPAEAKIMQGEGVRAGYPDYVLDEARGGYFGWRGELKKQRLKSVKDYPRDNQYTWLEDCRRAGYWANWHKGGELMFRDLLRYMALPPTTNLTDRTYYPQPDIEPRPLKMSDLCK